MGLNIGIEVKALDEDCRSKIPTEEEIKGLEDRFRQFLQSKFPSEEGCSYGFFCSVEFDEEENKFEYDVRLHSYCKDFTERTGKDSYDIYTAIFEFIVFNTVWQYDLDFRLYWSG
jgi:hypothetical protein